MTTPELLALGMRVDPVELERLHKLATAGPWQLQDGCSWRRIGTLEGDGDVLCPDTYSREDRHPDLRAGPGEDIYANLELIVFLRNNVEAILQMAREHAAMREALEPFAKAAEHVDQKRGVWVERDADGYITGEHLFRARAALSQESGNG